MLLLKLEQKMKHKRNYLLPYELKQKWKKNLYNSNLFITQN